MTTEKKTPAASTPPANALKPRKKNKISRRENNWHGWVFIAPYALIFSIFILVPVVLAVILSFTNFNAIEFPSWVGFLNYITLLTSDWEVSRNFPGLFASISGVVKGKFFSSSNDSKRSG